LVMWYF